MDIGIVRFPKVRTSGITGNRRNQEKQKARATGELGKTTSGGACSTGPASGQKEREIRKAARKDKKKEM